MLDDTHKAGIVVCTTKTSETFNGNSMATSNGPEKAETCEHTIIEFHPWVCAIVSCDIMFDSKSAEPEVSADLTCDAVSNTTNALLLTFKEVVPVTKNTDLKCGTTNPTRLNTESMDEDC